MPESTGIHNKRDLIIGHNDGTLTYTVAYEAGDLNLSIPLETVSYYLDRGLLGTTPSVRKVDDQPMTFGYSAYFRDAGDTGASYVSLQDLLVRFSSGYVESNWTPTLSVSDEFLVNTTIQFDGTWKGEADKTYTLNYCSLRGGGFAEGDPTTTSVTGTSYQLRPTLS